MANRPRLQILGPLEAVIMPLLWQNGPATIKVIHRRLMQTHRDDIAYTTVMTTMNRLVEKGVLIREPAHGGRGMAYLYTPTVSRMALAAEAAQSLVDDLFGGDVQALIAALSREPLAAPTRV